MIVERIATSIFCWPAQHGSVYALLMNGSTTQETTMKTPTAACPTCKKSHRMTKTWVGVSPTAMSAGTVKAIFAFACCGKIYTVKRREAVAS